MKIFLENNDAIQLESDNEITGQTLAKKIKKDLVGLPLAIRINDNLQDLTNKLSENDKAQIITFDSVEGKKLFWHSSAHILAQAVLRLYPDCKPTIGPAIEEGFFYDFADLHISDEEFPKIETEVKKIIKERLVPERIEFESSTDAHNEFKNNPFKHEIIASKEETLSAYRQGEFIDLCTGPHIPSTALVQAFKILKTSGAYWRGDSKNEQLTRIYGISFPDKKQLSAYLFRVEEARKRDHRLIGKKLDLFSFHEEGPGMPFFHPKGMVLWNNLLELIREKHNNNNYLEIKTPVMLSQKLWEISGHWENYRENMYISEVEERQFAIKPMNCPGCMLFYKGSQYSYRQLPLRIAEIGNVHRHEMSGALSGLFRVRSFHQDDAHIFMKPGDIKSEIIGVLKLAGELYSVFGLEYNLELSTRPEKSIGTDEQWETATKGLHDALVEGGYDFIINEADGAFYGPKIDLHIKDAIGRTWQCGTIQLDMSLPERFDLVYDASDGSKPRPVMIHRAIYGSIERFLGILIEHYTGKFPLWFSPEQMRILTVADRHHEYAHNIKGRLYKEGFHINIDDASESIPKKIRNAQLAQVNYILVVGDKELQNNTINIRTRANEVLGEMNLDQAIKSWKKEIQYRTEKTQITSK